LKTRRKKADIVRIGTKTKMRFPRRGMRKNRERTLPSQADCRMKKRTTGRKRNRFKPVVQREILWETGRRDGDENLLSNLRKRNLGE
jgi:hypothetical protein